MDFEFAGKTLSDFNCITCCLNTNTNSGVREVSIGCELTFSTVKNRKSNVRYKTSSEYENVYTAKFDIIKNPCGNYEDDIYMTHDEVSAIIRWLSTKTDNKFVPYQVDGKYYMENSYVCYFGSFNVTQILINERIAGLTLSFNSNAPFGFGEEILINTIIAKKNETLSIIGEGDELDVICPIVSIRCMDNGKLKIKNKTTDVSVVIDNCRIGETIIMDGEHSIIYTDNNEHSKTLFNDFNYNYLEIDNSQYDRTENIYEISIPCEITISYRPIRKVGVL